MLKKKNRKNKSLTGFTMVETLVAMTIFALVTSAAVGLLISTLGVQRKMLAKQELLSQTSYLMEYMGRAMRMARKELRDPPDPLVCLTTVGRGWNYETNPDRNKIRFINDDGYCQQFYLMGGQIRQVTSTAPDKAIDPATSLPLTSPRLTVKSFRVELRGEGQVDILQPRVTLFLYIQGVEGTEIEIQTTISQRNPDVMR